MIAIVADISAAILACYGLFVLRKVIVTVIKRKQKQIVNNPEVDKWLTEASVEDMAAHLENGGSFHQTPDQFQRAREGTAEVKRMATAMGLRTPAFDAGITVGDVAQAIHKRKKKEFARIDPQPEPGEVLK